MIDVRSLRFRYPETNRDALNGINWQVEPGEYVLVAGQSGSGKSTLLRCLNGLIPHFHGGYFSGEVVVDGRNTRRTPPRELASIIGTVFQDPETQLVTDTARDEITFTLENLGHDRRAIDARTVNVCRQLGIEHLRDRRIATLSGGERQLVALAAALAPSPSTVLLDEPTSQLDPDNAAAVIGALSQQNSEQGLTVLLAEHRLARLLREAGSLLVVSGGGASKVCWSDAERALHAHGLLPDDGGWPPPGRPSSPGDAIITCRDVAFSYRHHPALLGVDLAIREGETVAVTGPNGSGKTTLLKHFIGLLRPDRGKIAIVGHDIRDRPVQEIARTVGYVPQQPTLMLHQETAAGELRFTLDALGRPGSVEAELAAMGLDRYQDAHPLDLSGGERQRLAIAAITVARPRLLLLDEPTRGLPWSMKRDLARMLRAFAADGHAVVVATHDEDFVRAFAARRIVLNGGQMARDEAFPGDDAVTTDQNRDDIPLLTAVKLD